MTGTGGSGGGPGGARCQDGRMGQLDGRVAVITGAASGMGLATARRFVAEGARVVVADVNTQAGERAVGELGDSARFARCDVSVEDDVASSVSLAVEAFGRLDVMFNNAGVGGAFGPITEIEADDWDATFAVLVRGVFLGIKHAARVMIEQGEGGSIINTASIAGLAGGGGPQAYSAAKAAVVNLSQTTSLELSPHLIRVNSICPGLIFTPLMHQGDEADAERVMNELQPLPRRGEGDDIAGAALWLAGSDSAFVTGQAITVDGGITAAGTRAYGRLTGTTNLHRMVGMAHGTTGRTASVRRLEEPDPS